MVPGDTAVVTTTVAMLFSDIEGSTRLLQQLGADYPAVLLAHRDLLRAAFEAHNGEEQGTEGDSFFVTFPSVAAAVAAALEGQLSLARHPWPDSAPVRVRIGLHVGAIQTVAGVIVGMAVHEAARIGAAAHGGQVIVSARAADMADALPGRARWRDLGAHTLKDIAEPVRLFQLEHDELPADFPPPRSQGATRNNLPAQTSTFLGRDAEIVEVNDLLAATRLLTLTGAGGAGKSRLALRVGADQGARFADGVWFVDLAPVTDPDAIGKQVVTALGLPEAEAIDVAGGIGQRNALLIVDNCEHLVAPVCAVVDGVLRGCPNVSVLATSREPLGISGEVAWRVPSLASDDAVELFCTRARAANPRFELTGANRGAVSHLCERLDAIPLALELAAARMTSLSVKQLAARLDQRFRLLAGGSRVALARQRTLQATVDWSYDLLSHDAQTLLRRLGVFVGGFTLEAAEVVGVTDGIDVPDVFDLLDQLVSKSLVAAEENDGAVRYRLLETIRQYALDRLVQQREVESARDAHAAWVIELAAEAEIHVWHGGEHSIDWLNRLDLETANVRAGFEWLVDAGKLHDATLVSHRLFGWLLARGRPLDGLAWCDRLRATSLTAGDRGLVAFAEWIFHSNLHGFTDGGVVDRLAAAMEGLPQSDYPALAHVGGAYIAAVRAQRGEADNKQAVEIASSAVVAVRDDVSMLLGMALQALAWARAGAGDLPGALEAATASLSVVAGTKLYAGESRTANTAARIALAMGDSATAARHADTAMAAARRTRDSVLIIAATQLAAIIRSIEDDITGARDLLVSILDVAADAQNDQDVAEVYNAIAWFAVLEGDAVTSEAYAARALELHPPDRPGLPEIRHTVAEAAYLAGDPGGAWSTLLEAADEIDLNRLDETSTPSAVLRTAAAIQLDVGNASHAAALLAAAEASVAPGTPMLPAVIRRSAGLRDSARAALRENEFQAAWDEGTALSVPDAFALAKSLPAP